jgi:hypothetical protein
VGHVGFEVGVLGAKHAARDAVARRRLTPSAPSP